ncbi:MAG: MarR family winged helix-turn-helix transcriptional regulator [Thermaerobacter sp.]|nr:MarR family winged helix-turn-helix transcriptional regulator [Thermaerobacter sp.]
MAQAFQRLERTAFSELGPATETQCRILAELLPARGMSISALALRVGSDRPWVSQVVERMRLAGLVEREPDQDDRRRVRVRLTAAGRRSAAQLRIALQEQVQRLLARIPSARRQAVLEALGSLADALEAKDRRTHLL